MKPYEIFSGQDLKTAEKIQQRRYQILVHSCIYYHLNDSVVLDSTWNKWSEELVRLQSTNPEIAKQVPLADCFADWDGSTGAFLPIKQDWVINIAKKLLANRDRKFTPVVKKPVVQQTKKRRLF